MKTTTTKLLRIKEVSEMTGLAISTLWKYIKNNNFVQPFKLSPRVTVFDSTEIEAWIEERKGVTYKNNEVPNNKAQKKVS